MEDKFKARLTGAAILGALLVLVVPELFRGAAHPPVVTPTATPTPDNAAPLNSYQIDLQPASSGTVASRAADPDVASVNAPEGEPAEAVPGSAAVPGPSTAEPAASGGASAKAPAAAKPAAPKPASAKGVAAKPVVAVPATAGAGHGWSVRLGIFSKRDNAQRLHQQLQAKGVAVTVTGPDGRGYYSVTGPRLPERGAASEWLRHVKALGFAGVLTEAP